MRVRRVGADAMLCDEVKMPDVSAPNLDQKMQLKLATPTTQCSDITYVIKRLPGSSDPIAVLERLGSGAEKIVELGGGWAEEDTFITLSANGHVSGCNKGVLGSCGATTEIYPLPRAGPPSEFFHQDPVNRDRAIMFRPSVVGTFP